MSYEHIIIYSIILLIAMIFLFFRKHRRDRYYRRRVQRKNSRKTENIYQEKKQKKLHLENQIGAFYKIEDDVQVYKENPEIVDIAKPVGKWRATNTECNNDKVVGFHLSSLYSPAGWYSWRQAVEDFLHAKENEQLLKVWINTTLGETWVDRGEVPDWKQLFNRREFFPVGTVPKGKVILTAGVDVQKDRLEVEVVAWGKNRENWSINYQVLEGDTGGGEVWGKLSELLNTILLEVMDLST